VESPLSSNSFFRLSQAYKGSTRLHPVARHESPLSADCCRASAKFRLQSVSEPPASGILDLRLTEAVWKRAGQRDLLILIAALDAERGAAPKPRSRPGSGVQHVPFIAQDPPDGTELAVHHIPLEVVPWTEFITKLFLDALRGSQRPGPNLVHNEAGLLLSFLPLVSRNKGVRPSSMASRRTTCRLYQTFNSSSRSAAKISDMRLGAN
jgi:hypothetical protein